jgi:RNA polymerase sigma factor (sigma-70 family)
MLRVTPPISDPELLSQFLVTGSEEAFAEILRRYGAMVYGICRRRLRNPADVDDAWQATFLLLARKARTIRKQSSLASWLHGAARRIVVVAQRQARHRTQLQSLNETHLSSDPSPDASALAEARETAGLVEEELARLPERYRAPLILHCLQGLPKPLIVHQLGWPMITVTGRLARGKALLRRRLTKRGIAPTVIAGILSGTSALRAWPVALSACTLAAATQLRLGTCGVIAPAPLALMKGVLTMAVIKKLQLAFLMIMIVSGLSLGVVWMLPASQADDPPQVQKNQPVYSDPELQRDYEALQGRWLERCRIMKEINYGLPATMDTWVVFNGSKHGSHARYGDEQLREAFKLEKTPSGKVMVLSSGSKYEIRYLYVIEGDLLIQTWHRDPTKQLAKRIGEAGNEETTTTIYQKQSEAEVKARIAREGGPLRVQVAHQLRNLVIAYHNYHSDYSALPKAAIFDEKTGKPLLSWRVAILPYVHEANLYKEFKLDEPWDSPHNKALLAKMPKIFIHPEVDTDPKNGLTHYQIFVGPETKEAGRSYTFAPCFSWDPKFKLSLQELTHLDGTSNTLMLAEARNGVPWTKPEDLLIGDDQAPLPELGAVANGDDFLAGFGDGSVRDFKRTLEDKALAMKLLRQLIGYKDGMNFDTTPILK